MGSKPNWTPTADDIAKIEQMAAAGATQEQIYHVLEIKHTTYYKHKKNNAEFADALKRGQSKGIVVIENALFKAAKGGNITAQIFFLKNRDRDNWQDVNRVEGNINHNHKGMNGFSAMNDEELNNAKVKRIKELQPSSN